MEEEKDKKGFTGRDFGSKTISILGELESRTKEGITVATGTIYDYAKEKFQQTINEEYGQQIESLNNSFSEVVQDDIIPRLAEAEEKVDNNIPYIIVYENQYVNIPCDAYGNCLDDSSNIETKVKLYHGNIVENLAETNGIIVDSQGSEYQYILDEQSGDNSFASLSILGSNVKFLQDLTEVDFHLVGESETIVYGKIFFNKVKRGKSAYEEWKDANPSIENPTINRFLAELKNTDSINGPKYAPDIASAIEDLTIYFIPNSDTTKFDIWLREDSNTITRLAKEIPGDITNYAGIYDVSEDNLDISNNPTEYPTLSDAIDDIAETAKKGGMTIKYIGTDGKYHQYRLIADTFKSDIGYWEEIVDESKFDRISAEVSILSGNSIPFTHQGYAGTSNPPLRNVANNNRLSIELPIHNIVDFYLIDSNYQYVVVFTKGGLPTNTFYSYESGNYINTPVNVEIATSAIESFVPDTLYLCIKKSDNSDLSNVTDISSIINIRTKTKVDEIDEVKANEIILNGLNLPFENKGFRGYNTGFVERYEASTRLSVDIPTKYLKNVFIKDNSYVYIIVFHEQRLPSFPSEKYGYLLNDEYSNTPVDIQSTIANIDGFIPNYALIIIKHNEGIDLSDVDINDVLGYTPTISNGNEIVKDTIKSFLVYPGALNSNYGTEHRTLFEGYGHTPRLIKVAQGLNYTIKTRGLYLWVYYYDENQAYISSDTIKRNTLNEDYTFTPIAGASYVRLSITRGNANAGESLNFLSPNYIEVEGRWGDNDEVFLKRPSDGYKGFTFSVKTDTCKKPSDITSEITKQYELTTDSGVIHLPASYNERGKPTPLIIYIHGEADRYKNNSVDFATNNPYAPEWDAAGYAQMDVDLVPDCYNYERTGISDYLTAGTSDDAACIEAAYEWVINHYNIARDGVYLIGRSRGGQAVMQVLGHYNPDRLPVLCAISNAGANSLINYEVFRQSSADEWALFCDAHGLPNDGRPAYTSKARNNIGALISNSDIAAFLRDNIDVWWNKAATALPLLVQYPEIDREKDKDYPEEGNDFALRLYDLIVRSYKLATSNVNYGKEYCDWLKKCVMRSPVPLRFDWCVGDQTQVDWETPNNNSYAKAGQVAFCNDNIGCKAEYRVWPTADNSGTQQNPHWHELMNYLDGDYKLANGVVIHNPSMARLEWLLWCQAHDRRVSGCVNPIEVE